ncbi:hypothetical protein K2173_011402 [Erythroxylum novogranatense]|uniref:Uncharacterized protein n=1 Tax=Erythroxylum novogranatense TaxID=1862640 RepID=A0AAV8S5Z4_9ROSI|nr:hypothetical protein K2173_011402 [Erythroxylum novogranatense]
MDPDPDPDSAVRGFVRICNFKYHHPFRVTFTASTWFLQKLRFGEVREYIDNTETYVNIQLDNKRNELIQLQPMLTITASPVALAT